MGNHTWAINRLITHWMQSVRHETSSLCPDVHIRSAPYSCEGLVKIKFQQEERSPPHSINETPSLTWKCLITQHVTCTIIQINGVQPNVTSQTQKGLSYTFSQKEINQFLANLYNWKLRVSVFMCQHAHMGASCLIKTVASCILKEKRTAKHHKRWHLIRQGAELHPFISY